MGDDRMREWMELGAALAEVNPERFREVQECVREIVEVQEMLAGHAWPALERAISA